MIEFNIDNDSKIKILESAKEFLKKDGCLCWSLVHATLSIYSDITICTHSIPKIFNVFKQENFENIGPKSHAFWWPLGKESYKYRINALNKMINHYKGTSLIH